MSKYQRKKLLKCTTAIAASVKQGDFDGLFFGSNFRTVNMIFGGNQLYQKNFTSFGNEMSKAKLQLSLAVFIHEKNAFTWSAIFFALNFI